MIKRAAIYSRVSTDRQTTENQERELREIAERIEPGRWSRPFAPEMPLSL